MARIDSIFKTETKKADVHPKRITKWIHYTKLRENRKNYRAGDTDEKRLLSRKRAEQLADLIEMDGEVLQELLVRKADTDEYEIIAGHHRCMACKILVEERGKKQFEFLPCVVRDTSDVRAEFSQYSTNGYDTKTDYEIMYELERMKYLLTNYPEEFPDVQSGRMVDRLSKKLNMPKTTVGEYLTISKNLGESAMDKFKSGELKKSAAVQMASLPEEEQDRMIEEGKVSLKEVKEHKKEKAVTSEQKSEIMIDIKNNSGVNEKDRELLPGQYSINNIECTIVEEQDVPESGTFPKLKNMDEREAFINGYQSWNIWCKNECTEETFYRYDLPNGGAIIVKEYPYSDYWDKKKERIGKNLYLLLPGMRHFKNAESNMTEIKEHLKNLNKEI